MQDRYRLRGDAAYDCITRPLLVRGERLGNVLESCIVTSQSFMYSIYS